MTTTVPRKRRRRSTAAVHDLVLSNRRLVFKMSLTIRRPASMTLEDVEQAGFIGLLQAAQTFNPSLGFRFSTYACVCILRRMRRAAQVGARSAREVQFDYHGASTCDTIAEDLARRDQVEQLLACVQGERDREIVRLRYGLVDGVEWTLQAIGLHFRISRERINQVLGIAMHEMRTAVHEHWDGGKDEH